MNIQDSYFDQLDDSKDSYGDKEAVTRVPPALMGFETFKKNIKPEDLAPEIFKTPIKPMEMVEQPKEAIQQDKSPVLIPLIRKYTIEFHSPIREYKVDKRDVTKFKYEVNKTNNYKELLRRIFVEVFDRQLDIDHTEENQIFQEINFKVAPKSTSESVKVLATAFVPLEPKFTDLVMLIFINRTSADLFKKVEKDLRTAGQQQLLDEMKTIEHSDNFEHFKGRNNCFNTSTSLISKMSRNSSMVTPAKESSKASPLVKEKVLSAEITKPVEAKTATPLSKEKSAEKPDRQRSKKNKTKGNVNERVEPIIEDINAQIVENKPVPEKVATGLNQKKAKNKPINVKIESVETEKAPLKSATQTSKPAKRDELSVDEKVFVAKNASKVIAKKKAKEVKPVKIEPIEEGGIKKRPPEVTTVENKAAELEKKSNSLNKAIRSKKAIKESRPQETLPTLGAIVVEQPKSAPYFCEKPKQPEPLPVVENELSAEKKPNISKEQKPVGLGNCKPVQQAGQGRKSANRAVDDHQKTSSNIPVSTKHLPMSANSKEKPCPAEVRKNDRLVNRPNKAIIEDSDIEVEESAPRASSRAVGQRHYQNKNFNGSKPQDNRVLSETDRRDHKVTFDFANQGNQLLEQQIGMSSSTRAVTIVNETSKVKNKEPIRYQAAWRRKADQSEQHVEPKPSFPTRDRTNFRSAVSKEFSSKPSTSNEPRRERPSSVINKFSDNQDRDDRDKDGTSRRQDSLYPHDRKVAPRPDAFNQPKPRQNFKTEDPKQNRMPVSSRRLPDYAKESLIEIITNDKKSKPILYDDPYEDKISGQFDRQPNSNQNFGNGGRSDKPSGHANGRPQEQRRDQSQRSYSERPSSYHRGNNQRFDSRSKDQKGKYQGDDRQPWKNGQDKRTGFSGNRNAQGTSNYRQDRTEPHHYFSEKRNNNAIEPDRYDHKKNNYFNDKSQNNYGQKPQDRASSNWQRDQYSDRPRDKQPSANNQYVRQDKDQRDYSRDGSRKPTHGNGYQRNDGNYDKENANWRGDRSRDDRNNQGFSKSRELPHRVSGKPAIQDNKKRLEEWDKMVVPARRPKPMECTIDID